MAQINDKKLFSKRLLSEKYLVIKKPLILLQE